MQAILTAVGKKSRLGELAANRPKSFVGIKGKRLIVINVYVLMSHAGSVE